MAANAVIGALRVNLGMNTAAFERGAKRAKGQSRSLTRAMKVGAAAIAAAFTAAFASVGVAMRRFINDADNVAKASQSLGISTEELSRLGFAADLAGVSFETLTKSIGKLAKTMADSMITQTSASALAFKALNIEVANSDGTLRDTTTVMEEIADRFAQMEDGSTKTAIAMAIFGRSGAQLIPLLNEGAAGIQEMKDEADLLGITLKGSTAAAAEQFNDTLTRIGSAFRGITNRVAEAVLPAFLAVAEHFFETIKQSEGLKIAIDSIAVAFKALVSVAIVTGGTIQAVADIMIGAFNAIKLATEGEFGQAKETIVTTLADVRQNAEETAELLRRIWSGVAPTTEAVAPDPKTFNPKFEVAERKTKKLASTAKSAAGQISDAFRDAFQSLGLFGNRVLDDLVGKLVSVAAQQFFKGGGLGGFGLSSAFQGTGGSSFSSNFGGFFANGGVPPAGKISFVGENGTEAIVGNGRARVIPNDMLGGGTVVNVVNNTGAEVQEARQRLPNGREIVDLIIGDRNFDQAVDARFSKLAAPGRTR